jgi:hypothetical protein
MTNELLASRQQARAAGMQALGLTPDDGPMLLVRLASLTRADALVIGSALVLYDHIAADLHRLLAQVIEDPEPSEVDENLLFWGIHVMGGARDAAAFPGLLRLLSLPDEQVERLLGDATTITLPKLIAGTFNGDHAALMALIERPDVDVFLRWSAMSALAFLTFDGRIERAVAEEFLRGFHERRLFDEYGTIGAAWAAACGLLGLASMAPLVKAAYEEGLIDAGVSDYKDWTKILADAHERPTEVARFHDEGAGYFEDLTVELAWVVEPTPVGDLPDSFDDERSSDDEPFPDDEPAWFPPIETIRNPLRHVGRNDPCPCGSGKKYKKCCLNNP